MKRAITIVAAVMLLVTLSGCNIISGIFGKGDGKAESLTQTYTNEEYAYSIKYPSNWEYSSQESEPDSVVLRDKDISNYVGVLLEVIDPIGIETYTQEEFEDLLSSVFDDVSTTSFETMTKGDSPVVKMRYDYVDSDEDKVTTTVFFVEENDYTYIIQFTSFRTTHDRHTNTFAEMFDTFKIS